MQQTDTDGLSLSSLVSKRISSFFKSQKNSLPINLHATIIEHVERPLIIETLRITHGNQIRASEILGLNRNTLRKKIKLLIIDPSEYK